MKKLSRKVSGYLQPVDLDADAQKNFSDFFAFYTGRTDPRGYVPISFEDLEDRELLVGLASVWAGLQLRHKLHNATAYVSRLDVDLHRDAGTKELYETIGKLSELSRAYPFPSRPEDRQPYNEQSAKAIQHGLERIEGSAPELAKRFRKVLVSKMDEKYQAKKNKIEKTRRRKIELSPVDNVQKKSLMRGINKKTEKLTSHFLEQREQERKQQAYSMAWRLEVQKVREETRREKEEIKNRTWGSFKREQESLRSLGVARELKAATRDFLGNRFHKTASLKNEEKEAMKDMEMRLRTHYWDVAAGLGFSAATWSTVLGKGVAPELLAAKPQGKKGRIPNVARLFFCERDQQKKSIFQYDPSTTVEHRVLVSLIENRIESIYEQAKIEEKNVPNRNALIDERVWNEGLPSAYSSSWSLLAEPIRTRYETQRKNAKAEGSVLGKKHVKRAVHNAWKRSVGVVTLPLRIAKAEMGCLKGNAEVSVTSVLKSVQAVRGLRKTPPQYALLNY